ncbi:hypothetical protein D9758_010472 [Tetrapyrgos nigripes]|uniref:CCHC-type domain-containing protein n=1 Tax=Tetrapyrgos nigripes TaxID=182062 RepID=A0A8H5D1E0_9AGAR|nr:hypothetical protein D9758_010472 [Tetrapyrgos nigripes]
MDELADCGVTIPDSQFKSAIISSTPDMYQATIKALITVYREEPSKLTPEMLIAAIRTEAQGKNFASSSNKSQKSANYSNDNFQGRGHGRFRGRGGRGRGNSRGGQGGSSFRGQGNFRGRGRGRGGGGGNWQGNNQTREEPSCYNCRGLGHFSKNCTSKHMQHTNVTREHQDDRNYKEDRKNGENGQQRNGKGRDTASSAREKNEEDSDEGSWMAIEIPEIEDPIDHPTIDCSDIAEEAAFIALEHTPPILFDSGCSSHMSSLRDQLRNYQTVPTCRIQVANSDTFTSQGKGTLHIETVDTKEKPHFLPLHNTLYCPDMPNMLVSLSKLDDTGYNIHIEGGIMVISKQGCNITHIPKVHGLYQIIEHENAYSVTNCTLSLYEAHCATEDLSPDL